MDKAKALETWQWGCAAIEQKGQWVRNGNWLPLSQLLRHRDTDAAQVTVVEHGGSTILKIEPAAVEPPRGKSALHYVEGKPAPRPAFHLIVR